MYLWRGGRDSNTARSSNSRLFAMDLGQGDLTRVDVSAREPVAFGPNEISVSGAVEERLAVALERAAAAERWDIVAQLVRELAARRLTTPRPCQAPR
jgi:hypothetical protein